MTQSFPLELKNAQAFLRLKAILDKIIIFLEKKRNFYKTLKKRLHFFGAREFKFLKDNQLNFL